jgi:hypothetical protein
MFNRENMQQISNDMNLSGPNISRLEGMASGVFSVLQMLITSLSMPGKLWEAGVGNLVANAPVDGRPAGSQYTRRWWYALQMALAVFTVATKTPISTLKYLALTDGTSVVLDAEGNLIRPFLVFDENLVPVEFQNMNLELLAFSEAETVAPVAAAPEVPVVEEPVNEIVVA